MNKQREIKLLCRSCSTEEQEKAGLGYYSILAEDKSGLCEKCLVDTGHLKVVEIIISPNS